MGVPALCTLTGLGLETLSAKLEAITCVLSDEKLLEICIFLRNVIISFLLHVRNLHSVPNITRSGAVVNWKI